MKKIFILTILLAVVGLTYALLVKKDKPPVSEVLYVTDQEGNVTYSSGLSITGAPIDSEIATKQLFTLLKTSRQEYDGFTIEPLKKDLVVRILVSEPHDMNTQKAKTWLEQNGYGQVDSKRLQFVSK